MNGEQLSVEDCLQLALQREQEDLMSREREDALYPKAAARFEMQWKEED
jgi:hypothetical protein